MADMLSAEIRLRDLLCHECVDKLQPVKAGAEMDYFEVPVSVPDRSGGPPVTVPVDFRNVSFTKDATGAYRVTGHARLPCPNCEQPHDIWKQMEAVELYVKSRRCPQGHEQALDIEKMEWHDGDGGPVLEFSGKLICHACGTEVADNERIALPSLAGLDRTKLLAIDTERGTAEVSAMSPESVPLPAALTTNPFASYPMLNWASARLRRKLGLPFKDLHGLFVLHFLADLVPFAQACLDLGITASGSVFFYKSQYKYPQREAIGRWLTERGFEVRPVEDVSAYLAEAEERLTPATSSVLVVEDGGYIVPALHAKKSPLLNIVIGAVEQTTKGLRRTEDWGASQGSQGDLAGIMEFPLISIPDSDIKKEVEPRLIGHNVLNSIWALDPTLNVPGMRVGLLGLGTIGMEVFKGLKSKGALVDGYDMVDRRRLQFTTEGGHVVPTAALAVRDKKLVIGCSGRPSIDRDVIANLPHGAVVASASSDRVEIDLEYLEERSASANRLGMGGGDWAPGRPWAGTRYVLNGTPARQIDLLADGFPVTFWGFQGMPTAGADLIMTVILIAAAELAARNGPARQSTRQPYGKGIGRTAVDELGKSYEIETEYLRHYYPQALGG